MTTDPKTFVAFAGTGLIARGAPAEVVRQTKDRLDRGEAERIALYDDESGRPVDIDFTGGEAEVLARLADHPMVAPTKVPAQRRGPGRPKLGVVSREVSLLPRHWSWLAGQRGGASASLRRLVDTARKGSEGGERARRAIDAAHRFMWDLAGDQPGFEEASRALYAKKFDTFSEFVSGWPVGIREQLERFIERASSAAQSEAPPTA